MPRNYFIKAFAIFLFLHPALSGGDDFELLTTTVELEEKLQEARKHVQAFRERGDWNDYQRARAIYRDLIKNPETASQVLRTTPQSKEYMNAQDFLMREASALAREQMARAPYAERTSVSDRRMREMEQTKEAFKSGQGWETTQTMTLGLSSADGYSDLMYAAELHFEKGENDRAAWAWEEALKFAPTFAELDRDVADLKVRAPEKRNIYLAMTGLARAYLRLGWMDKFQAFRPTLERVLADKEASPSQYEDDEWKILLAELAQNLHGLNPNEAIQALMASHRSPCLDAPEPRRKENIPTARQIRIANDSICVGDGDRGCLKREGFTFSEPYVVEDGRLYVLGRHARNGSTLFAVDLETRKIIAPKNEEETPFVPVFGRPLLTVHEGEAHLQTLISAQEMLDLEFDGMTGKLRAIRTQTPGPDMIRNVIAGDYVTIPAGTFAMGSPNSETGRSSDETPHQVTISKSFEMQTTPVTQLQWRLVMGENPSHFKGDDRPVESVSWNDVQKFIAKVNEMDPTHTYRLPTEAEWEYAARGGTQTAYYFGNDPAQLADYAWFYGNSGNQTHPVGQKKPNPYGLHDMHGNVWQWVQDWYGSYPTQAVTDSTGPQTGSFRVLRGGSRSGDARYCRSA